MDSRCPGPVLTIAVALFAGAAGASAATINFSRDVRPILSGACFTCHGPDAAERKAGLRLDTPEGGLAMRKGHAAIVPGHPDRSEAIRRMTTADRDDVMPPPDSGKSLTVAQIEIVRQWIVEGARWSGHWAFEPPQRPVAPGVNNLEWVENPIDAFALRRLEREGLQPSPVADRLTLFRRLHLDLIGLPPTIEEADAFLADRGAGAYERAVDRLLKSPHYGERWGRLWLDAARYSDSDGYEKDKPRSVWFYRDWVINALNRDLPYDQFIVEQLAGDLLPNPTQDQRVATGFLRNSMINEEGGVDPEQFRMDAMFDRMDAIGKSVLGVTIQCAQCHTHKYDPLTQEEYYRMFAFINDSHEASIAVYAANDQIERARILREIHEIEADLKHRTPDWEKRMAKWEAAVKGDQPEWTVLDIRNSGNNSQRYDPRDDGSQVAHGYAPTRWTSTFTNTTRMPDIRAFRLEMFTDPNLPAHGPGRAINGLFALTEFKVEAVDAADPKKKRPVKFVKATADFANERLQLGELYADKKGARGFTGPAAYAIDGKADTAWGIDAGPGRRNQDRKAVFLASTNLAFPKGTKLTFSFQQNHGGWNSDDVKTMNLGRFRVSATSDPRAAVDSAPRAVRKLLAIPAVERSAARTAEIFSYWRTTVKEWKSANDRIEALWKAHPESSTQLTLERRAAPRMTSLLHRGDWLKPQKKVDVGTPAFLHGLKSVGEPTRLDFARWLVDRKSPTAARSIVNRIWQGHFGIGIVSASEDLGSQSEAPSHPELLDWLAVEFMESGWSLKSLHKVIVTSSTYRQSSRVTPELYARDPYNRLLARGARFRVDAEIVRDIALAASGLLDPTVGGPSVHPPAPQHLFLPPASYGPKTWNEDHDGARYRRAMYTFGFRSVPFPMLQAFDAPNGDFSCVRRTRSNTPLQALATLNEPVSMECARALGALALRAGGSSDEARMTFAFRRCLTREPTAEESRALLDLLDRQKQRFQSDEARARELIARPADVKAHPGEAPALAAWTVVARALLNLDETITKE
jgi:hypothetical protein